MDRIPTEAVNAKLLLPALLAAIGGVVRVIQRKDKCNWRGLVVGMITSAFAGVVVHLLVADMAIGASFKAGIVGVSGFASGDLLRILAKGVCNVAQKGTE